MLEEEILEMYVDASVVGQKACIAGKTREILSNGEERFEELFSMDIYNAKTTEAEILACVYALEIADRLGKVQGKHQVVIYSDSRLVVNSYRILAHWVGQPRIDYREWKELAKQREIYFRKYKIRVDIKKVEAHGNNFYNNSVDALAKNMARGPGYLYPKQTLILSPTKNKKHAKQKNQSSGILKASEGQITIRVNDYEYWRRKTWRYKYEFISPQNSSWVYSEHKIYSKHSLDIGKTYLVRVKQHNNQSWIVDAKEFVSEME